MVDKVRLLKIENTSKGSQTNLGPTEINPQEDYSAMKGISFEESDDHLLDRDGDGNLRFKDTFHAAWKTFKSFTDDILGLQTSKYDASNPSNFETPSQLDARDTANRERSNHTGSQAISTVTNLQSSLDSKYDASNPSGFESASQLNDRDTANRERSNHTGSQAISTVTNLQSSLDSKYDASNPSNFETPAQLDARDTSNKNRSNHTGTQLAETISDLPASVRSVVLDGLSTIVSSEVLSTDTLLQAIGKLQAQIGTVDASNYDFSFSGALVIAQDSSFLVNQNKIRIKSKENSILEVLNGSLSIDSNGSLLISSTGSFALRSI